MSYSRKFFRERLQMAINHIDTSQQRLAEAYALLAQWGEYYGKYKEYLTAVAQLLEMSKQQLQYLLDRV